MSVVPTRMTQDPDALFTRRFMPEIVARSRRHFSHLDPEARQEAVQDCVCRAWSMYRSAVARGKTGSVTAQPNGAQQDGGRPGFTAASLAMFSNLSFDSGVRFTGLNRTDVMAPGTRAAGRVCVSSIDGRDDVTFHDVFADRRALNDPAWLAQTTIDWDAFAHSDLLNEKGRKALGLLATGHRNGELARELGVCPSRASQIVHDEIGEAVVTFFGPSIMPTAGRRAERGPRQRRQQRGPAKRPSRKRPSRARRRARGAA